MPRPAGFTHTEATKKKLSKALKGRVRSPEYRRNISKGKLGEKNGLWKGDAVGYQALHTWIRTHWGTPKLCEHCEDTEAKAYDWANVTGIYNRQRKNWKRLCRSCHIKLDRYGSITV